MTSITQRKHIVIVTTSFPESSDGSEAAGSFVRDFAQALSGRVEITVVCPGSKQEKYDPGPHLHVVRFSVKKQPLSTLRIVNPLDWIAILNTLKEGNRALEQVVLESPIDHIFALWALPSGYWARTAFLKHGIHYSIWALGSDIWSLSKIPVLKTILRTVLIDAHNLFADGFVLAGDVEKICQRPCQFLTSSRLLTVSNKNNPATSAPYKLAFIGRWHKNKGPDLLLDGLEMLTDEDWSKISAFRFAGGGALEELIRGRVEVLKGQQRPIELSGYLNKREAVELISWADYLLIPSRIESIPVVFSDAMQCRTPIICTPVGDLPELVSQYVCGAVAKNVSPEAISEAIRHCVNGNATDYHGRFSEVQKIFSLQNNAEKFLESTTQATR